MYENAPKPNSIQLLKDDFLLELRKKIISGVIKDTSENYEEKFINLFNNFIESSNCFHFENLNIFKEKEIVIGCHHYIDGILIQNGLDNVQILENEYKYYERLNPAWNWASAGNLIPNKPMIIATPFPGYLDLHPNFEELLDEAEQKNIDVHLDCAWLSCSNNLTIDVSHPSIKSIGISLSKGYSASWNRIGVRYTKEKIQTDPITIFNNSSMCPESCVRNGISILENVPVDYMWNTYGEQYYSLIEKFNLDVGKVLFAAYGKDRIIYSLSHLFE